MGHDRVGGLKPCGRDLVKEMDRLGIILDVTHLCDDCFWEALDLYSGPVWASHSNCRALVLDSLRPAITPPGSPVGSTTEQAL